MDEIVVRRLTPELLHDYLRFFDEEAFTDNPDWAGCYCYFYLDPGPWDEWPKRTGSQNRAAVVELIAAGKMHGYLAYLDERPVGWCHAAPRVQLPKIDDAMPDGGRETTGSILCFVIRPANRRQGIARRLLAAACEGFRADGLGIAEAYPAKSAATDAQHYHGHLEMYLADGFVVADETERFHIVRRKL